MYVVAVAVMYVHKTQILTLNTSINLLHGVIHNIFKGSPPDSKFENPLNPNITWLEEASTVGRDIVDPDPWVTLLHPTAELQ